jgi:hypothetical protein
MARIDNKENGAANGAAQPVPPTIEQVRELLFGDAQRSTSQKHAELDAAIEALRRDMLERFAMLESRMADMERETDRRHAAAIDAIGVALTDLGAHVRKLAEPARGRK